MNDIPSGTAEAIRDVLFLEEQPHPNWDEIGDICNREISRLNETGLGGVVNGLPYQFLEDHDVRRKDPKYGEWQRAKVRDFLAS